MFSIGSVFIKRIQQVPTPIPSPHALSHVGAPFEIKLLENQNRLTSKSFMKYLTTQVQALAKFQCKRYERALHKLRHEANTLSKVHTCQLNLERWGHLPSLRSSTVYILRPFVIDTFGITDYFQGI